MKINLYVDSISDFIEVKEGISVVRRLLEAALERGNRCHVFLINKEYMDCGEICVDDGELRVINEDTIKATKEDVDNFMKKCNSEEVVKINIFI